MRRATRAQRGPAVDGVDLPRAYACEPNRAVYARAALALLATALIGSALSSCGGAGHTDAAGANTLGTTAGGPAGGDVKVGASSAGAKSGPGGTRAAGTGKASTGKASGPLTADAHGAGSDARITGGGDLAGSDGGAPQAHTDGRTTGRDGPAGVKRTRRDSSGSHGVKHAAGAGAAPAADPGPATSGSAGAGATAPAQDTYEVRSLNMEPTYKPYVNVYYDPADTTPTVDQVVVFRLPTAAIEGSCGDNPPPGHACQEAAPGLSSTMALGRVVAGGGEAVAFREGDVVRDDQPQEESFTKPCGSGPVCTFSDPITVPAGSYYIAYDNRSQVDDSRVWGAVPQAAIVGVVNGVAGSS